MFDAALNYPFRGEDSTERLIIGGALPFISAAIYLIGALLTVIFIGVFILPFAIIPRILLWGYLVTVVAAVLRGQSEPPAFSDWKRIGVDGLKAALITLGYAIPLLVLAVVIFFITFITGSFGAQTGASPELPAITGLLWGVFAILAAIYGLAMYYVLPAAIVNFVREDDLGAAFHLRTIGAITFDSDYLVGWLLAVVVIIVGGIFAYPLYFVLLGFVLKFYTLVVAAYLITRGCKESMGWTASIGPGAPSDGPVQTDLESATADATTDTDAAPTHDDAAPTHDDDTDTSTDTTTSESTSTDTTTDSHS